MFNNRVLLFTLMIALFLAHDHLLVYADASYQVVAKFGNTPTIDGSISVGEWSDASTLSSNDTQVLVKQDGTNLYIGFSTSGINPQDDLGCGMFLDPNHDKGYELRSDDIILHVFSNGTTWEGHVSGSGWGDPQNATGWTAKSSIILDMWQAEFNISYSTINVTAGVEKTLGAVFVSGKIYDPLPSAVWPPGYDWRSQRETPEQWGELSSGSYYWIPELPAFQILLILMPVTFLAGVTLRKKDKRDRDLAQCNGKGLSHARAIPALGLCSPTLPLHRAPLKE